MATGNPELRLDVSLNIDGFKRTALPALAKAASEFEFPIAVKFDRDSITNEMRLLGRQLGQRKYRIDLDDTSIKSAIESANKLAAILSKTKGIIARAQAIGGVVGTAPAGGGPTAPQVKAIYSTAKDLGIVKGLVNRTRDELVADLKVGFASAGGDAVEGLIRGLLAGEGKLAGIAASLGDVAVKSLKESLEIRSPSRRFFRIGQQSGQGYNDGLIASIDATMGEVGTLMNTSLRRLDRMVEMRQRKARAIAPLQPNYELAQRQAGAISGQREKVQVAGEALQLGASAGVFQTGSYQQLTKLLQSAQIQANLITPNTPEWNQLQGRIAGLNHELQQAGKLADEIQMRHDLAAFSPDSLSSLESRLVILKSRAKDIDPNLSEWKELNKEIQKVERNIERASRKPLTKGQRFGAAGGAFLYGGGLGGGAGSALGGIVGGLTGGVPGAFTGAAVGQAADDIAKSIGAMTDQAATISKLQKGLASASNDLRDYASASAEVERISSRLLIPIEEVYRKFTQLKASTVALNIDAKTTGEIFEGTAAAVLQSGGSLEDVDGAMRAVVQVFSKGKLTAEELRGQLGERLPGAVVEFAQSAGMSVQELDKAFEAGTTSLDDFVEFLKKKNKDTKKFVDGMATDSEYAGARMEKAFEKVRLNIGSTFQPAGAAFQDFFTNGIKLADLLINKMIEAKLIKPGPDFYAAQAIAGGDEGVKKLETNLLAAGAKQQELQNSFIPGIFGKQLKEATQEANILEEALKKVQAAKKLTNTRKVQPSNTLDNDKQGEKILDAIEKREESIADARQKREEEIADIRKRAIEQAKQLEEEFAKQKLSREREIAKAKRDLAQSEKEAALGLEATRVGLAGGNPKLARIQEEVSKAVIQREEEKIALEEKILDEQSDRAKKIEDLKFATANAINESNARYAKAIGETQQNYARSVAKIIDKGSENASKRLIVGAQISALYQQRSLLNQTIALSSQTFVPEPQKGMYPFSAGGKTETYTGAEMLGKENFKNVPLSLKTLIEVDKKIATLSASLSKSMGMVATPIKAITVNTADLEKKVLQSAQAVAILDTALREMSMSKGDVDFIKLFIQQSGEIAQAAEQSRQQLQGQLEERNAVLVLRKSGMSEEQAQQQYKTSTTYDTAIEELRTLRDSMVSQAANPKTVNTLNSVFNLLKDDIIAAKNATLQFSEAINNVPTSVQLSVAVLDIKEKLKDLLDPAKQIIGISDSIATSFGEAFKQITMGTATAQQAFASLFQNIASSFADMAAQLITQYLKIQLIQGIGSLLGLGGGASTMGGSGFFSPLTGKGTAGPNFGLANGGILPGKFMPITAFADGGIVRGPTMGLVGEGRYNEAVVPLPDGKSIPVDLSGMGGGAGAISTNIVINVSNGQAQSNTSGGASDLGRKMEGAVKQVLVNELRPGGLLGGGRR